MLTRHFTLVSLAAWAIFLASIKFVAGQEDPCRYGKCFVNFQIQKLRVSPAGTRGAPAATVAAPLYASRKQAARPAAKGAGRAVSIKATVADARAPIRLPVPRSRVAAAHDSVIAIHVENAPIVPAVVKTVSFGTMDRPRVVYPAAAPDQQETIAPLPKDNSTPIVTFAALIMSLIFGIVMRMIHTQENNNGRPSARRTGIPADPVIPSPAAAGRWLAALVRSGAGIVRSRTHRPRKHRDWLRV